MRAPSNFTGSLRKLALCLMLPLLAVGCMNHYDMTLNNGGVVRSRNRPKLNDQGVYVYKDINGRMQGIPQGRVRKIEAVSPGSSASSSFN